MTQYLLDTDTLIDFSKGREPVVSLITTWIAKGNIVGVCPINITEFYSGLPQTERKDWDEFFESLMCWEISKHAARVAGEVRYEFRKGGIQLSTTDALISAVATEHNAVIVTSNIADYPMAKGRIFSPREHS